MRQLTTCPRNRSETAFRVAPTWLLISDSEKRRPAPLGERIRPSKRDSMMAVQSRTADLPAPFTPTRTLICSGNSNLRVGIPRNPSMAMESTLIALPPTPRRNAECGPQWYSLRANGSAPGWNATRLARSESHARRSHQARITRPAHRSSLVPGRHGGSDRSPILAPPRCRFGTRCRPGPGAYRQRIHRGKATWEQLGWKASIPCPLVP